MKRKALLAAVVALFAFGGLAVPAEASWVSRCAPCYYPCTGYYQPSYYYPAPCYYYPSPYFCSSPVHLIPPPGTVWIEPPPAPPVEKPKYTHLNAAIFELREAKEEVRNLKGVPDPLREKALGAIDSAIDQTKKCLADLGVVYKYVAPDKSPYLPEDKDYKHLRQAIHELREAKDELRGVKGVTDEHRSNALAGMDDAIERLKEALESAPK